MSKGVRSGEGAFALVNQSHAKKKTIGSPMRMRLHLYEGHRALQKLDIFFLPFWTLLKAHFLKPINFGSLDLSRVRFLEGEYPP